MELVVDRAESSSNRTYRSRRRRNPLFRKPTSHSNLAESLQKTIDQHRSVRMPIRHFEWKELSVRSGRTATSNTTHTSTTTATSNSSQSSSSLTENAKKPVRRGSIEAQVALQEAVAALAESTSEDSEPNSACPDAGRITSPNEDSPARSSRFFRRLSSGDSSGGKKSEGKASRRASLDSSSHVLDSSSHRTSSQRAPLDSSAHTLDSSGHRTSSQRAPLDTSAHTLDSSGHRKSSQLAPLDSSAHALDSSGHRKSSRRASLDSSAHALDSSGHRKPTRRSSPQASTETATAAPPSMRRRNSMDSSRPVETRSDLRVRKTNHRNSLETQSEHRSETSARMGRRSSLDATTSTKRDAELPQRFSRRGSLDSSATAMRRGALRRGSLDHETSNRAGRRSSLDTSAVPKNTIQLLDTLQANVLERRPRRFFRRASNDRGNAPLSSMGA